MLADKGTLYEIEEHWSLDDVLDMNEALDLQNEADRIALKRKR